MYSLTILLTLWHCTGVSARGARRGQMLTPSATFWRHCTRTRDVLSNYILRLKHSLTHSTLGLQNITQHLSTTDGDGSFCQVNRLARLSAGNWMEPRVRYWILYRLDWQCKCSYFVVTIGARVVLWLVGQTEETIKWWFLKRQIAFGKNGKICLLFRCSICGSYLLMGITEKIKTFTLKNLIMPLK